MNAPEHVSPARKPEIPDETLLKWQIIVDLMAKTVRIPAGLIMKAAPPHIEVLVASATEANPYKKGERADLNTGLYCETVMAQRSPLLVPNALKDPKWDHNPDIELGMISYLGFPLQWPDGEIFGTLCVLDLKENRYSKVYEELISQFKELVETNLALLFEHQHLEDVVGERTAELKKANEQLRQEITEHKRAEEALRFSEANLKRAQEVAKIGSWYLDVTKDELFWSDETYHMFGVPRGQPALTYEKFLETVHPDDRESVDKAWMAALRNEPYDIEHRIIVAGEVKWVREKAEVESNEEGQTISGIGTVQDITERKQAEEELKNVHQIYREVIENAQGVTYRFNYDDGTYAFFGKGCEELFGIPPNELTVEKFRTLIRERVIMDPEAPSDPFEYAKAFKMGEVKRYRCDIKIVTPRGEEKWISDCSLPIVDQETGNVIASLGILYDITERKQAEEKLRSAFSEIEQLKERLEQENIYLQDEIEVSYKHEEIIGKSDALKSVLSQVELVADTDSTVLLLGETGTGKELLARAIHKLSSRKQRPLIKVNCAALPSTLVESELFGREKGAYTGALTKQVGRFEVANGSTIFLDEISETSLETQAKLLRVLEEGRFERLGSSKTVEVDVRVIAATNRELSQAVKQGKFRQDLYYRIAPFPILVPPLRERREDIPLLVWAFVKDASKRMGKHVDTIPRKTMEALQQYPWPGNVREMRNVIERAIILTKGTTLGVDLPMITDSKSYENLRLEDVERGHILDVLERTGWRVSGKNGAAEILGVNEATLRSRMKKLSIRRPE